MQPHSPLTGLHRRPLSIKGQSQQSGRDAAHFHGFKLEKVSLYLRRSSTLNTAVRPDEFLG